MSSRVNEPRACLRVVEWPRLAGALFLVVVAVPAPAGTLGCAALWDETPPGASAGGRPRDKPDDRDPGALIPAGMQTVIDLNMAQLRQSPWVKPALDARDVRSRVHKEEALGYDETNDVDRMLYAVTAAGADAPTLVIAQGRLQQARVEEAFRTRWPAAVVDRWRGVPVLASGENALAFLTPRTFAAGAPYSVKAVIDRAFGVGLDVSADPGLGPLRRALCPEAIGSEGGRVSPMPVPTIVAIVAVDQRVRARVGDTVPLPPELRQIGLRADVGRTADLSLLGMLDTPDAAATLARRLRFMLDNPGTRLALRAVGLGGVPSATQIASDGARVSVRASIDEESRPAVAALLRSLVASPADQRATGSFGSW